MFLWRTLNPGHILAALAATKGVAKPAPDPRPSVAAQSPNPTK